jgi:hypothetical protein
MMTRRRILQLLAGLPFIGAFVPKEAEAAVTNPISEPADWYLPLPPLNWEELADQLWSNLEAYLDAEERGAKTPDFEKQAMKNVCYAFCKYLQDWSLAEAFVPGQKHIDFAQQVRFDAFVGGPIGMFPNAEGQLVEKRAMSRRIRLHIDRQELEGIHNAINVYDAYGKAAAFEVQYEIRRDYEINNGEGPRVYALYLPPYLLQPIHPPGWSCHRGWHLRYSKWR